jgi:hypothetical protein
MIPVTFTVKVAGCNFRLENVAKVINEIDVGNPVVVKLEREPDNQFDPNAVRVVAVTMDGDRLHVGFIPRAEAMKAGEALAQNRIEKIVIEKAKIHHKPGSKPYPSMTLAVSVLPKS